MIVLPLTRGQSVLIDDEDAELVMRHRWWSVYDKKTCCYRAMGQINGRKIFLSRFLLGAPEGMLVDHINGNTLDDRRSNLRLCTGSQNQMNRQKPTRRNPQSRFKGVNCARNGWKAGIRVNGRTIYLGQFKSEIDAALAYNAGALKYHGEFACLNQIQE